MPEILVIDDDRDIRLVLQELLELEGFSVSSAKDGQEGLAALARLTPPALVIVDLIMPGMDGVEFIRHARAARPEIPILVLSASSIIRPPADVPALRKPISPDALLEAVGRLLV